MLSYPQVVKPIFGNLKNQNLNFKDILVYVTIRSFYNSLDKFCYPTYSQISKLSGLSTKVIKLSIMRLEAAGYLTVTKVAKTWAKNIYTFSTGHPYQLISSGILLANDLSVNEKAFLLLLHEYAQDSSYESPRDIADITGMSYSLCAQMYKSLKEKDYVSESVDYDEKLGEYVAWISLKEKNRYYSELEPSEVSEIPTETNSGRSLLLLK